MPKAVLLLKQIIQDSQEFGSTNEHMISRVFLDLTVDDQIYKGLYCNVKQSVGSSYTDAPLEVSKPIGYAGAFNYEAFSQIIEQYYRKSFGAEGAVISFGAGSSVRMQHNTVEIPHTAEFEISPSGGTW